MRRLLSVLITASLLLTFCACSKQVNIQPTESPSETKTEEEMLFSSGTYKTRKITCKNGSKKIYGIAYIPEDKNEKHPLVLLCYGLGGTYSDTSDYAEELAKHGVASYAFDFCGGSTYSKSDGKTTEMSVMTEVSDLEVVLTEAKNWDFVESDKILSLGESQGGIVSAITAARHPDSFAGLILLYPALVVTDDAHARFNSINDIPDTYSMMGWITVGKNYAADMWDYDVYSEIGNFKNPVLLLHGSSDTVVPYSYSVRADEVYENSTLKILDGAGHGFWGSSYDLSVEYIINYLSEINII